MSALSKIQISDYLSQFHLKYWNGVYSNNNIPKHLLNKNFAIIVNLSKEHEKDSHFICIAQIANQSYLFDSLSLPETLYPPSIRKIIKSGTILMPYPVQSNTSSNCGYYCIFFIMFLSLTPYSREIYTPLNFSTQNIDMNDLLCKKMIIQIMQERMIEIKL